MDFLMGIINLFFTALISVVIVCRRSGRTLGLTSANVVCFVRYTLANVIFAHVVLFLIRRLTGMEIALDSAYYTILALVLAWLLPYAAELIRKRADLHFEIKGSRKTDGDGVE